MPDCCDERTPTARVGGSPPELADVTETMFPVAIRRDPVARPVGTLWGETARRFEFTPVSGEAQKPSRLGSLLEAFRSTSTSESPSEHRQ